ncbi:MAG: hypothetical protein LUO93_11925 [Methanomicrobiales archaeon]|nr:hypothetical protein [Methanomicrobiales archaeon]
MAEKTCPQCGVSYPYEDEICPACGYQVEVPSQHPRKSPSIAALLSFFFFGGGQIYNGQIRKGIIFFLAIIVGIFIYIIPGAIIWVYGMYDAAVTSSRMNSGAIPDIPTDRGRLTLYIFVVLLIYLTLGVMFAAYVNALNLLRLPGR